MKNFLDMILALLREWINNKRWGTITVTIQDGKVVAVEKKETVKIIQ